MTEALKYKNKIMLEVQEGKRGSGYTAIRRLGEGPAENTRNKQFRIQAYVEEGLTPTPAVCQPAGRFFLCHQPDSGASRAGQLSPKAPTGHRGGKNKHKQTCVDAA